MKLSSVSSPSRSRPTGTSMSETPAASAWATCARVTELTEPTSPKEGFWRDSSSIRLSAIAAVPTQRIRLPVAFAAERTACISALVWESKA